MSNILKLTRDRNPKLECYEIVTTDGDYSVIIGKMGEGDNPHYLIVNTRYGVIEAGSGAMSEVPKLFEFCLGRPPMKGAFRETVTPDLFVN